MDEGFQKSQETKIQDRIEDKLDIVVKPTYKEYQKFGRTSFVEE